MGTWGERAGAGRELVTASLHAPPRRSSLGCITAIHSRRPERWLATRQDKRRASRQAWVDSRAAPIRSTARASTRRSEQPRHPDSSQAGVSLARGYDPTRSGRIPGEPSISSSRALRRPTRAQPAQRPWFRPATRAVSNLHTTLQLPLREALEINTRSRRGRAQRLPPAQQHLSIRAEVTALAQTALELRVRMRLTLTAGSRTLSQVACRSTNRSSPKS